MAIDTTNTPSNTDAQTAQAARVLNIATPQGTTNEAYTVEPGDVIRFEGFDPSEAIFSRSGNNLIISLPNKPNIMLLDFASDSVTADANTVVELADGTQVSADSLLAQLTPSQETETTVADSQQRPVSTDAMDEIEPAAGPAGGAGGGFTPPPVEVDTFGANDGLSAVIDEFLLDNTFGGQIDPEHPYINQAPIARDDIADPNNLDPIRDGNVIKEDANPNTTSGNVLDNDSDPEGDPLSVANPGTYQLQYGTLTINADGTYTYTLDNSHPTVDGLSEGKLLHDNFIYVASDGRLTAKARLEITIIGTNDAPILNDDFNSIKEDSTPGFVTGNVLDNDTDVDTDDVLTVSNPGTYQLQYGTLVINADGTYTYTLDNSNPTVNALDDGDTLQDVFIYNATDGYVTDNAKLTITINGTNDGPDLKDDIDPNDDRLSIYEDAVPDYVEGNVLDNDSDPEGHALSVVNPGTYQLQYGTLTINPDGSYRYTLDNSNPIVNALKDGDMLQDPFVYTATDGSLKDNATLTITIHGANDGPVANNDVAATDENTPITIPESIILANDYEPEGDSFGIVGVRLVSGPGAVVLNADGSVTYTPQVGYNGPVIVEYTIEDTDGLRDTAEIHINVNAVNSAIDANDDAFTTKEDTPITMSASKILENDIDPDGDTLTITDVRVVSGGGVAVLQPNGDVTYTPAPDYNGPVVLEYTVTDGTGNYDSAFINIDVTPVNDAPIANDDTFSTREDTPITIPGENILINDTDPDGDSLTITDVKVVNGGGTVTLNPDGSVTYVPAPGYSGPVELEYTIDDGNGGTDTAIINIGVQPATDADAADDFATTKEDTPITIDASTILANDSSSAGGLTITGVRVVSGGGSVTLDANGNVVYTPAPDYTGPAVLSYDVVDADGNTDSAQIHIAVTPVNEAPTAVDDVAIMNEDSVLVIPSGTLLANDSDPDGDPLTVVGVRVVSGGGTATLDAGGNVTYVPVPNYNGPVVLEYTIDDGHGHTDSAFVNIDILPVNDAPDAQDDFNTIKEDATPNFVTGNVLDNDTDVDGDTLLVGNPGTYQLTYGTLVINADGSYTYTLNNDDPRVNALGNNDKLTDTFTYQAHDGQLGTDAKLTITILGTNDGPELEDDFDPNGDKHSIKEDAVPDFITGNVLENDTDPEGDTLTVTSTGTYQLQYGTLEILADGSYKYTLDNSNPTVNNMHDGDKLYDSFTYTASDGELSDTAKLTITIHGTNDLPIAVADTNTVKEDVVTIAKGNVLDNDYDTEGDTLTVTNPGTYKGTYGTLVLNADGTYTYTLNNSAANVQGLKAGEVVNDVFNYKIDDGYGGTASSTLTIKVEGTNDAPIARPDTNNVKEDVTLTATGNVLSNDTDVDGDTLTVTNSGTINGTYGKLVLNADGTYTYTLNNSAANVQGLKAGEVVNDVFTYTISDGQGGTAQSTLTIKVEGTNDGPIARPDTNNVKEDVTLTATGNVLSNDTDVDGDTLTVTNPGTISGTYGKLVLNADGTYTYTLNNSAANVQGLKAGEVVNDVFTYKISDGQGGTAQSTLTIKVEGTNDGPVARDDSDTIRRNASQPATGNVLTNDTDIDGDVLTVTNPGTYKLAYGTLTLNANGTYSYAVDNSNATVKGLRNGDSVSDTFTYKISDGNGGTDEATLTIRVDGTNEVPVARPDTNTVKEDVVTVAKGNVLTNDTDADGDALNVTNPGTYKGTYGTLVLNADGTYTYTLNNSAANVQGLKAGQVVNDVFTYNISDGHGGTASSKLTIKVEGTNDAPIARDDSNNVKEDVTLTATGNVLSNDTDVDGDTLTVTNPGTINGTYGKLVLNANGTYTYTLNNSAANVQGLKAGQVVNDVFTYKISDGNGGTDEAKLTIRVEGTNDNPVAVADTNRVKEDVTLTATGNVLSNDYDVDGDALSVTNAGTYKGTYGTVVINANGTYTYTLNNGAANVQGLKAGQVVKDTFAYTISDGKGGTAQSTLTINVEGTNDGPTARDDFGSINNTGRGASTRVSTNIFALNNDTDPDGDALQVISHGQPRFGSVSWDGSKFVYTTSTRGTYTETFTYTISDGNGGTSTATVTINVNNNPSSLGGGGSSGGGGGGGGDCPLIIDLDGDGLNLIGLDDSRAFFDLDADGNVQHTAWAAPSEGFLAMDWDGNGIIDNVNELFGNSLTDGFSILAQLDSNGDGVIDANDELFDKLLIWQDLNGDGFSSPDELKSLSEYGITSISLGEENPMTIDGQEISHTGKVTFEDGRETDIYSVWFENIDIDYDNVNYQINGVDHINARNGEADSLSISLGDVIQTEHQVMMLSGDNEDTVNAEEFTVRGDDVDIGGVTYASYMDSASSATLLVELGVIMNGEVVHENS